MKIAIRTSNGNYLTAVNGGGMGDPVGDPENSISVHTNARILGGWETFTLEPHEGGTFGIKCSNGQYLNAVGGGGMTGQPPNSAPIITTATSIGPNETFVLVPTGNQPGSQYAFQTPSGMYISAVNGGGMGDAPGQPENTFPIHTNATIFGGWEAMNFVIVSLP